MTCSSMGFPATGTNAFGMESVMGLSRVPSPAAKISAFNAQSSMLNVQCFQLLLNILLSMNEIHLHTKLLVEVLSQMLGGIYGAMLAASASEADGEIGELTLYIAFYGSIYQGIDML